MLKLMGWVGAGVLTLALGQQLRAADLVVRSCGNWVDDQSKKPLDMVFEVDGGKPETGAKIVSRRRDGTKEQNFRLVPATEKGYFWIESALEKMVLDVDRAGTANGTVIKLNGRN